MSTENLKSNLLEQETESEKKERLLLMDTPSKDSNSDSEKTKTLGVGEVALSFDHLGPMVINTDGSISRISNWDKLSDLEKTRTSRLVTQRNAQRLTRLREKETNELQQKDEASKQDHPSSNPPHTEL
ncbi:hypothetical protein DFH28DRAFT_951716 [Melampsora americana]|nr:hypothetical protein DFH28DRAFT_951716 [Melampsora americana]